MRVKPALVLKERKVLRKNINKLPGALLILLALTPLCSVSCIKSTLKEKERNLIQDVERFNRDYGSKGITVKNKNIDWRAGLRGDGLILKNSLIKNVNLQTVKLRNMYIENSKIENVTIRDWSDFSGSTFKNVKFKNIKFRNDARKSYITLEDSMFIDCEFVNCEFEDDVILGKDYINCKFTNCKILNKDYSIYKNKESKNIVFDGKIENVVFKNSIVRTILKLKDSKNIQFINCPIRLDIKGKIDGILIQNSTPSTEIPFLRKVEFFEGTFNNVSIIDCKKLPVKFYKANLNNLLIKDSTVRLEFEISYISGNNKIENSKIIGNLYGKSKIRNLTITNCNFEDYINIVLSEFIGLRLNDNTYDDKIKHAVWNEKYTDSDKFPLESKVLPEDDVPDRYFDIK